MTLTAARAQLALDLARRHAATLDTAVAVSVVDDAGNLMCCSRSDGAAAGWSPRGHPTRPTSPVRLAYSRSRPPSLVPGHASSRPSSTRSTGSTSDTAATFRDTGPGCDRCPAGKVVCDYLVARSAT
ncbi:heme-binding protein [Rhodococcus opacus]|uniref:heme-binding protein n=1 Tax=Rhodococcus opacus TaxID=37919 RepID=UPI001FD9229E